MPKLYRIQYRYINVIRIYSLIPRLPGSWYIVYIYVIIILKYRTPLNLTEIYTDSRRVP